MIYLHNIRVRWARKIFIHDIYPVSLIMPENWETLRTQVIKEMPLAVVDRETFNRISKTLQALPSDILALAKRNLVAIKCEEDYLAIDTAGYDYPRYKSYIVFQENY